jgi:ABC-type amino acid transport system permease subunit
MKKIILPQAFKNILPALFNELITLLKETSVAAFIAVADLTRSGDMIRAKTYDPFLPLFAVAVIYLVLVVGLTQLVGRLERRLRRSDNR